MTLVFKILSWLSVNCRKVISCRNMVGVKRYIMIFTVYMQTTCCLKTAVPLYCIVNVVYLICFVNMVIYMDSEGYHESCNIKRW